MASLRLKKHLPIITTAIIVSLLIGGGWWFFAYGGNTTQTPQATQQILNAQHQQYAKGDPDAPVTVIEYADVLCPYCSKMHREMMPQLQADYIDTGKVYFEMRLVGEIAPDSTRAAQGAYCAGEQDKFWQYMDSAYHTTWKDYYTKNKEAADISLFRQDKINDFVYANILSTVSERTTWQACMSSGKHKETIADNKADMDTMKAYGTPHFSINGKDYNGAPPYSIFEATIKAALNEHEATQ